MFQVIKLNQEIRNRMEARKKKQRLLNIQLMQICENGKRNENITANPLLELGKRLEESEEINLSQPTNAIRGTHFLICDPIIMSRIPIIFFF